MQTKENTKKEKVERDRKQKKETDRQQVGRQTDR